MVSAYGWFYCTHGKAGHMSGSKATQFPAVQQKRKKERLEAHNVLPEPSHL